MIRSAKLQLLYSTRGRKIGTNILLGTKIFTEVIGLTPTGRATIETLKLNRKGVINLRWALFAVGKHPPK